MGALESSMQDPSGSTVARREVDGTGNVTYVVQEREETFKSTALQLLGFGVKTIGTIVVMHYGLRLFGDLLEAAKPESTKKGPEGTKKDLISGVSADKRKENDGSEKKIQLNSYEARIARELVDPQDIRVDFSSIGGLEDQKNEIQALVVDRFRHPDIFGKSKLLGPPPGILLHGPPGTGKTMLAKAVARESGATFLSVNLSSLFDKYFGESQKLVRAIFSLAEKLSPTIVFIDEIDAFLKQRGDDDQRVLSTMKAEFMTLWDGMGTDAGTSSKDANGFGVVIVGASNRPNDIDPAFQRRLARKIYVGLPTAEQRLQILRITMADDMERLRDYKPPATSGAPKPVSEDADSEDETKRTVPKELPPAPDFFEDLARDLEFYSGHDIKELCRVAILTPIQEFMEVSRQRAVSGGASLRPDAVRKVTPADFYNARAKVFSPGDPTIARRRAEAERQQRMRGSGGAGSASEESVDNIPGGADGAAFNAVLQAVMAEFAAQQQRQQQEQQDRRRGKPRSAQPPPFRQGRAPGL